MYLIENEMKTLCVFRKMSKTDTDTAHTHMSITLVYEHKKRETKRLTHYLSTSNDKGKQEREREHTTKHTHNVLHHIPCRAISI